MPTSCGFREPMKKRCRRWWKASSTRRSLLPAERALLDYVAKVTEAAYRTTPEDVQKLRDHGWTEPQIAEAVYITAMFAFFNRVADAFGVAAAAAILS